MEKLLITVALLVAACSCAEREDSSHPFKYKVGDVIYIKPDSTTAVVVSRDNFSDGDRYEVKFYDVESESSTEYIKEFEIYGIK
jgi:hypothetical protein